MPQLMLFLPLSLSVVPKVVAINYSFLFLALLLLLNIKNTAKRYKYKKFYEILIVEK